ncbi:MAG TPA: type I-E CRISPR-associated protein Cas5/CasD [Spirochaetota bacterium]|nr:type I-E CRISPR-associated protein Cas5/CasD [Spirochaetota bacterium]HPI90726.1 type I-E CRISPR-associated protein Cas5/CasD [Spirochaetota bacterium]HPR49747.1 type I-E CRISPR-associated protein Cas5/CasD [Spirochaetota bacterium]
MFQLYAPLMSWGETAVGMERRSSPQPSRSAVIGLVAASLGIKREDDRRQILLAEKIGVGVKLLSPGIMIRDFHTIQIPQPLKKRPFFTRRDEVTGNSMKTGTVLSKREYRCDSMAFVALWINSPVPELTVESISAALKKPVYQIYFGRKSCPPALPLMPYIVEADTMRSALDRTAFPEVSSLAVTEKEMKKHAAMSDSRIFNKKYIAYYWDDNAAAGIEAENRTARYDQPADRTQWRFSLRHENSHHIQRERDDVFQPN